MNIPNTSAEGNSGRRTLTLFAHYQIWLEAFLMKVGILHCYPNMSAEELADCIKAWFI